MARSDGKRIDGKRIDGRRIDGRKNDELREIKITRDFIIYPEGSVLIEFGNTKVICNATVDETLPAFMKGASSGWVTAEYSMMPRATSVRTQRDITRLKQNPRSMEIQRLIGRALRVGMDMKLLGERTITVDCDVVQADGGTRTASITGGFIAMYDACSCLIKRGVIEKHPIKNFISAISVGIVDGEAMLDLCYDEDHRAGTDLNIVMNDNGEFVELQGTAEGAAFSSAELIEMINLGKLGTSILSEKQKAILL